MERLKPLELLKSELLRLEKALHKSNEFFKSGDIKKEVHETHKSNLEPMIFDYKAAINFLKNWI